MNESKITVTKNGEKFQVECRVEGDWVAWPFNKDGKRIMVCGLGSSPEKAIDSARKALERSMANRQSLDAATASLREGGWDVVEA